MYCSRSKSIALYIMYLNAINGRGPTTAALRLPFPGAAVVESRFPVYRGRDRFGPNRNTGHTAGSGTLRNVCDNSHRRWAPRRLATGGHIFGQYHGRGCRRPGRLFDHDAALPGCSRLFDNRRVSGAFQQLADHFRRAHRSRRLLSLKCTWRHRQHIAQADARRRRRKFSQNIRRNDTWERPKFYRIRFDLRTHVQLVTKSYYIVVNACNQHTSEQQLRLHNTNETTLLLWNKRGGRRAVVHYYRCWSGRPHRRGVAVVLLRLIFRLTGRRTVNGTRERLRGDSPLPDDEDNYGIRILMKR